MLLCKFKHRAMDRENGLITSHCSQLPSLSLKAIFRVSEDTASGTDSRGLDKIPTVLHDHEYPSLLIANAPENKTSDSVGHSEHVRRHYFGGHFFCAKPCIKHLIPIIYQMPKTCFTQCYYDFHITVKGTEAQKIHQMHRIAISSTIGLGARHI